MNPMRPDPAELRATLILGVVLVGFLMVALAAWWEFR